MKKTYFLLIALCFFVTTKAQIVTIPDANFKEKLLEASSSNFIARDLNGNSLKIDTNSNREIEVNEALNVYYLNLYNSNLSDLNGIKNFRNLTNLDCSNNQINSLDITTLLNLDVLHCTNNQITSLDVTSLVKLVFLFCGNNKLTLLNTAPLVNLKKIDCSSNLLT